MNILKKFQVDVIIKISLLLVLIVFSNIESSYAKSVSGCKKDMIYDGVYFFKTKANNYAGPLVLKEFHYSGREGSFEDCKKFWRTHGDARKGYIRSWETKMIVSKDEYCEAKHFHNWFGFGKGGIKYCDRVTNRQASNNFIENDDVTMYIYPEDVDALCESLDARCQFDSWGIKFKKHIQKALKSKNHAIAFVFPLNDAPGYQTSYGTAYVTNAKKMALEGCEEMGYCEIVIVNNKIVNRALQHKLSLISYNKPLKDTASFTSNYNSNYSSVVVSDYSDKRICLFATSTNGLSWEKFPSKYYDEALNRGLSIETCNNLTNRIKVTSKDSSSIKSKLKELKGLLDEGLISREQYDEKSSKILDNF
jgi:hypothetical protein